MSDVSTGSFASARVSRERAVPPYTRISKHASPWGSRYDVNPSCASVIGAPDPAAGGTQPQSESGTWLTCVEASSGRIVIVCVFAERLRILRVRTKPGDPGTSVDSTASEVRRPSAYWWYVPWRTI